MSLLSLSHSEIKAQERYFDTLYNCKFFSGFTTVLAPPLLLHDTSIVIGYWYPDRSIDSTSSARWVRIKGGNIVATTPIFFQMDDSVIYHFKELFYYQQDLYASGYKVEMINDSLGRCYSLICPYYEETLLPKFEQIKEEYIGIATLSWGFKDFIYPIHKNRKYTACYYSVYDSSHGRLQGRRFLQLYNFKTDSFSFHGLNDEKNEYIDTFYLENMVFFDDRIIAFDKIYIDTNKHMSEVYNIKEYDLDLRDWEYITLKAADTSLFMRDFGSIFRGNLPTSDAENARVISEGSIFKRDSLGKLVNDKSLVGSYILSFNKNHTVKIDRILDEYLQDTISVPWGQASNNIVYGDDSSIFLTYIEDFISYNGAIIEKYDQDYNLVWKKFYIDTGIYSLSYAWQLNFLEIVPVSDGHGGLFVAFTASNWSAEVKPYYLWIDGDGNIKKIKNDLSAIKEEVNSINTKYLYPNPARDKIYLKQADKHEKNYRIYNILGQEVQSGMMRQSIDVNNLKDNMYFLHIEDKDGNLLKYRFEKAK